MNNQEGPLNQDPLSSYDRLKLKKNGLRVNWVPEDLHGMKEILKLSKVTQRMGENWKDNNNRVQQLRHLDKEGEVSPLRNVISQAKQEEMLAA